MRTRTQDRNLPELLLLAAACILGAALSCGNDERAPAPSGTGGDGGTTSNVACIGYNFCGPDDAPLFCCELNERCAYAEGQYYCEIACMPGQKLCDGACRSVYDDPAHCGDCDSPCPGGPHATPVCNAGSCKPAVCDPGYRDCDDEADCEALLGSSSSDCGGCGAACDTGEVCVGGSCLGFPSFLYAHVDAEPTLVAGFAVSGTGELSSLVGSPWASGAVGAGLDHHPDGLVLCSGRLYSAGHEDDVIAGYAVAPDGALSPLSASPFPSPSRVYGLACAEEASLLLATNNGQAVLRFSIAADGALADSPLGSFVIPSFALGIDYEPIRDLVLVASHPTQLGILLLYPSSGQLSELPGTPHLVSDTIRSVVASPDGRLLAFEQASGAAVAAVTAEGTLALTAQLDDPSSCEPAGLAWAPDGSLLFAGHRACSPAEVTVYAVDYDGGGALVGGSPFASGAAPDSGPVALAAEPTGTLLFAGHESGSIGVLAVGPNGSLTPVASSPAILPSGGAVRGLVTR